MKFKKTVMPALIIMLFAMTSCSSQILQPGDMIVPPAIDTLNDSGSKSTSILNNMNNMGNAAKPSSEMEYTIIDKGNMPVSIFADTKYLYILENKGNNVATSSYDGTNGRYGNTIGIYDIDNGNLVRRVSNERFGEGTAFTVKDSNIYVYDMKTGDVSLFSSTGSFLSSYDTGMAGILADKIEITGDGKIILKVSEHASLEYQIAIYNINNKKVNIYDIDFFCKNGKSIGSEINDFCIYNEKSILVNVSNGQLDLFDMEDKVVEKTCYFPKSIGFIEFDGNVLYYSSEEIFNINPGNAANFSNVRYNSQTERLLINNDFNWPKSESEFETSLLNSLQMTLADKNGRHYRMAYNTRYLFFLDFIPSNMEGENGSELLYKIYRIVK